MAKKWYVIHTYSGYENKVKTNLEHRIESMGMEDKIYQVLVPMEDEIEIRQGQRHTVQKKVYPGYVLVEMILDPDSWYVVRNTPGVTSFVGGGNIPGVTRTVSISIYDQAQALNYAAAGRTSLFLLAISFTALALTYALQRRFWSLWPTS